MPTIDQVLRPLLRREGGLVNDPTDAGGETKFGISHRAFPNINIKDLTEDAALALYKQFYFETPKINLLPEYLWPVMVDYAVNSGPFIAIQKLQTVIGAEPDGVIGAETIHWCIYTAGLHDPRWVVNGVVTERVKMLCSIVIKAPTQIKFLRGWVNRAFEFLI